MNLLTVIPYCSKDLSLAKKLLGWMSELQPRYLKHSCLLVADHEVPQDDKLAMQNLAKPMFEHTETMIVRVPAPKQIWPDGPNIMFASAARQVQESFRLPWLWLEPDAVPILAGWLDAIARAYAVCPKRFMGSFIPADNQPDMPPVHLSGCAVYPPNAWGGLEPIMKAATKAFDIALAGYLIPRASNCVLMQHYWGQVGLPPTFSTAPTPLDPKNVLTLDFLKPNSVLFHRCKDGTLIDLLRERANSHPVTTPRTKVKETASAAT